MAYQVWTQGHDRSNYIYPSDILFPSLTAHNGATPSAHRFNVNGRSSKDIENLAHFYFRFRIARGNTYMFRYLLFQLPGDGIFRVSFAHYNI